MNRWAIVAAIAGILAVAVTIVLDVRWTIVAAVASILAVVVSIFYGEMERRRRPRLEVSLPERRFHYDRSIPVPEGYALDGYLLFELKNAGGTVAHNVESTIEFDTNHLELLGFSDVAKFGYDRLPSGPPKIMQVNLRPHDHGRSKASFHCTYDEGKPVSGTIEFEIPNPKGVDSA
jgi:hypothetical protein